MQTMKLPVSNRAYAIGNIILWSLAVSFFLLIGLSISTNITIIVVEIIIALLFTFNMIKYYNKRNVKSVFLEEENIIVNLAKIKIPYKNVYRVVGGIGGIGYKGEMIKSYIIYLKKEYVFGNEILARYEVFDISREAIERDYIEIEILKERAGLK